MIATVDRSHSAHQHLQELGASMEWNSNEEQLLRESLNSKMHSRGDGLLEEGAGRQLVTVRRVIGWIWLF